MSYSAYIMDDMDEHGSATYTWNAPSDVCPICGKSRFYVGDYLGGPEPWCTCGYDEIDKQKQIGKITISEDIEFGYTDGSVGCALPDLRYTLALMLGAVVVALALVACRLE